MLELFNKYKEHGKIQEALLVGRNMVNREPKRVEYFTEYFELLIYLADNLPALEERKEFLGQANITLAFFTENVELDMAMVEKIRECEELIAAVNEKLVHEDDSRLEQAVKKVIEANTANIKLLYQLEGKLEKVATQEALEDILAEISVVDAKIEHDYLTEEQQVHYAKINKEYTDEISNKMRELEHKENIKYNKEAVNAYDNAFKTFKSDENTYIKKHSQLYALVSKTLFAYDAAKLFNETLIFYNHVYSYIFSKLDDDGKLALTRFSIDCERKLG